VFERENGFDGNAHYGTHRKDGGFCLASVHQIPERLSLRLHFNAPHKGKSALGRGYYEIIIIIKI